MVASNTARAAKGDGRSSMDLAMALLRADCEAAVTAIVTGDASMSNRANWRPCAGTEQNWGTAAGQQSEGGKAASEIPINGADTILLRRCREKGIDPTGKDAPSSMYAAVKLLLPELGVSKMAEMPDEKRMTEWARKNLLIGTNRPEAGALPCLTFVDAGEGQHPEDFESTFLSFSSGTKTNVPFVQGRHCVGSNGVLMYSGEEYYKLIVSRRYTLDGDWGWTLVRKRPVSASGKYANYVMEYYAPEGAIPSFVADSLAPLTLRSGEPYPYAEFPSCTVVRVFDYLVDRSKNNSYLLSTMFEENMVDTILPFRVLDFNVTPDPKHIDDRKLGVDARTMTGLEHKIKKGSWLKQANGTKVLIQGRLVCQPRVNLGAAGQVAIRCYYYDSRMPTLFGTGSQATRVVHSVFGQTHHKETRVYLSDAGLGALKDRLVVIVDSSELAPHARNEVWSPNRETIKKTTRGMEYMQRVFEAIRDNQTLKKLNEGVMASIAASAQVTPNDATFRLLARSDKLFSDMLTGAPPRKVRTKSTVVEDVDPNAKEYVAKEFPTDFRFTRRRYEVEIGTALTVVGRTDASNDFFSRLTDAGRLRFKDDLEHFDHDLDLVDLKDGRIAVTFKVKEGVLPGTEVEVQPYLDCTGMSRPARAQAFTLAAVKPKPKEDDRKKEKTLFPDVIYVTSDGRQIDLEGADGSLTQPTRTWEQEGLGLDDGGFVRDVGKNGYVHVINYDNRWHRAYLTNAKPETRKEVTRNFMVAMQIGLSSSTRTRRELKALAASTSPDKGSRPPEEVIKLIADLEVFSRVAAIAQAMSALPISMSLPDHERTSAGKTRSQNVPPDVDGHGSNPDLDVEAVEEEDLDQAEAPGDFASHVTSLDPVAAERIDLTAASADLFAIPHGMVDDDPAISKTFGDDVPQQSGAIHESPSPTVVGEASRPKGEAVPTTKDDLQAVQSRVMEVLRGNKPMRTSEIARRAGLVSKDGRSERT